MLKIRGSELAVRGSVGVASPNVTIQVCGGDGQVQVCGAMVMCKYWRRPDLTAAALSSGWLRTGHLGVMDDNGAVFLRGRASEMINVGGLKVAPAEVENLLVNYPGISDAACVGVPDPIISGQRVKAFVVSSGDVDPAAVIIAQSLERYKVSIVVERIDAIPKTNSGKPLHRLLGLT